MKLKMIFLSTLLLASSSAFADPAPFGLEIGKTTIKEMQEKYAATSKGQNKYSGGEMFAIDPSQIEFEGLREVTTVFSKDGQLLAVLTELPKSKFEYLYESMGKKYKLVSKEIPFVGNKSAKYVNGNTEISLDAPHMSFEMQMNYISKDLMKSFKDQSAKENEQKKSKEGQQL